MDKIVGIVGLVLLATGLPQALSEAAAAPGRALPASRRPGWNPFFICFVGYSDYHVKRGSKSQPPVRPLWYGLNGAKERWPPLHNSGDCKGFPPLPSDGRAGSGMLVSWAGQAGRGRVARRPDLITRSGSGQRLRFGSHIRNHFRPEK